jgi:uncharacterized protein (UPF0262 family)
MKNLADLRIDEATWDSATPLRRAEWRSACDDLLRECEFSPALEGRYLLVTKKNDGEIFLEAMDEEGNVEFFFAIARASLDLPITEYLAIIRRLDENAQDRDAAWFEAVDMAKKVVHDQAARVLASNVPELSTDLATLRKIFTLVLALFVDTTTLHHARGHGFRRADTHRP